jgi:carbamoyl-phosphate synthase large subunit
VKTLDNTGRIDRMLLLNSPIKIRTTLPSGKTANMMSYIRKPAIKYKIPYITTAATAESVAEGIKAYLQKKRHDEKSLQEYHKVIV